MNRQILSITLSAALLFTVSAFALGDAFANPYVGAWPNVNKYTEVDNAWMKTRYSDSTPSQVNCLIQSMLTTAGGDGTDKTGWIYQNTSFMYGEASPICSSQYKKYVFSSPEVWDGSTQKWNPTNVLLGLYSDIEYIKQKVDWQNARSQVSFTYEVKKNSGTTTLQGYSYDKSTYSDPSSYFMAGNDTYQSSDIKYLHYGVEGYGSEGNPAGWVVRQWEMGFYDDASGTTKNLSNMNVKAVQGNVAYTTWKTNPIVTGGEIFTDTDETSPTGQVDWEHKSGSTISNGKTLW